MNFITFTDLATFDAAVTSLETSDTPPYVLERDNLKILSHDVDSIVDILVDDGISGFMVGLENEPGDGFLTDAEADADALASAGFGTDEDYGYYGGEDE